MIYKKRSKPLMLVGLESLIIRLPNNHYYYPKVEEDLRKRRAGFAGELNFDKHINEFRPSYPIALLHDVCLLQNGVYFQMDSVMILPDRILIFEVKNLAGTLRVKTNPTQFIQEHYEERKVINSPITELDRKKIFLELWLKERGFNIPIKGIVALAFTNELHNENQMDTILAFTQEIPIILYDMKVSDELINRIEMKKLAVEMINAHQEYNPLPLCRTMNIPREEILSGVICQNCSEGKMQWQKKRWKCIVCQSVCANSHHQLLSDWFCLIDNKITNREFRSFSMIDDRSVAKRMLKKSGLLMTGKAKTAFYSKHR
ncbi:nuclease-related domain-containing protein [Sporosarcina oncorhynchi]|uniref:Nuclease-related domain-containing protein n=1 Tax=Sporosarcina oncorhynchi TaxID=3056444 RepID=A0ABZ0L611_9BACL|nr:nuclease-related domain-containing protein [Sporosarcina sp. T2O-4]WOV87996.1 nuclease-related domain-containing protein [Sporosarcina sp. T2O-4]